MLTAPRAGSAHIGGWTWDPQELKQMQRAAGQYVRRIQREGTVLDEACADDRAEAIGPFLDHGPFERFLALLDRLVPDRTQHEALYAAVLETLCHETDGAYLFGLCVGTHTRRPLVGAGEPSPQRASRPARPPARGQEATAGSFPHPVQPGRGARVKSSIRSRAVKAGYIASSTS
jgi:hypothetical protein